MRVRRAEKKDTKKVMELLSQVLEVHASIRPDIFVPGTTKYTKEELLMIFADDQRPVYVAVDDEDHVEGYAFCVIKNPPFSTNMVPRKSLFIDDLCVDQNCRGRGIGHILMDFVKAEARRLHCYDLTLNVWEGNDSARRFYENAGMRVKETQMEWILPERDA